MRKSCHTRLRADALPAYERIDRSFIGPMNELVDALYYNTFSHVSHGSLLLATVAPVEWGYCSLGAQCGLFT